MTEKQIQLRVGIVLAQSGDWEQGRKTRYEKTHIEAVDNSMSAEPDIE